MTDPLLTQLSHRVQAFIAATGISQRKLAKLIKTDESHLSAFLAGKTGLSAEKSLKLLQLLNASKAQLEMKLGRSVTAATITHLQTNGRPMTLDTGGGWVSGQAGDDPNNTSDITGTWKSNGKPSGDDIIDCLRQVQNIHRTAIQAIDDYIASTQKSKPNAGGVTAGPRKIGSNDTFRKSGPRGDMLGVTSKQLLEHLQRDRQKAEEELAIQKLILAERKKAMDARIELSELKKETIFSTK